MLIVSVAQFQEREVRELLRKNSRQDIVFEELIRDVQL